MPLLTFQVGIACAAEIQQQQQVRKGRQAGVPEGLVLTGRHYPKNNNGKYIPDNSGKYFQRNVKYIHVAGEKSATAINVGSGAGKYTGASAGKYVPDNSGSYNARASGKYVPSKAGQYVRSGEGQYVRASSEGKYPIKIRTINSVTCTKHHPTTAITKTPTHETHPTNYNHRLMIL